MRRYVINYIIHNLGRLAHGKPAYCVAVKLQLGYSFHMLDPQIGIGAALVYSEKHLLRVYRSGHCI